MKPSINTYRFIKSAALILLCCCTGGQVIQTSGMLHFKSNGQLFIAENNHARAYGLKQTGTAFIKAATTETMVIDVQWNSLKTPGTYLVTKNNGSARFTVMNKTYVLQQQDDFVKITVSSIKESGPFLLLKGGFTARLHDENGNGLQVTDGLFETFKL